MVNGFRRAVRRREAIRSVRLKRAFSLIESKQKFFTRKKAEVFI